MKALFLLIFFLFSSIFLSAQEPESDYRPFIEEGKVWIQEYNNEQCARFSFCGDTIVYGHKCNKLLYTIIQGDDTFSSTYALYEEQGRVWFFYESPLATFDYSNEHQDLTVPRLLYDFSSQVGDTLKVWLPNSRGYQRSCIMKIIDKIDLDCKEKWFRAFVLDILPEGSFLAPSQKTRIVWLEGVGTIYSPISNYYNESNAFMNWLYSCSVNDEIIYSKDSEIYTFVMGLITNSFDHLPSIKTNIQPIPAYYDLSGRRLSTPPTKGIYIRDGKKVIAQ